MPSEIFGSELDGYDIVETDDSIEVRCATDGALRAAAQLDGYGEVLHVAIEPSPYGQAAFGVLAVLLQLRLG